MTHAVTVPVAPAGSLVGRCWQVWAVAWPIIMVSAISLILSATDTALLGHYSTQALGSAAVAFPIWILFTAIIIPCGSATQVLVARWHGAGDSTSIVRLAGVGFVGVVAAGTVLAIAGIAGASVIVEATVPGRPEGGVDPGVAHDTTSMLRILLIGLPFTAVTAHLRGLLGGVGDTRTAAQVTALVALVNMPLAWVLIFEVGLGQVGSAIATTLATAFGAAYLTFRARETLGESIEAAKRASPEGRRDLVREWLRIAWPDSVFGLFSYGADVALVGLAAGLGAAGLAAFRVMGSAVSVVWVIIFGLACAIAILVGQRLGARDRDGHEAFVRAGAVLMLVGSSVVSVVLASFPGLFFGVFTDDPEVLDVVSGTVVILPVMTLIMVAELVYAAQLRALGDTRGIMYVSVLATFCGTVPAAWFFVEVLDRGLWGIYLGLLLGWIIRSSAVWIRFRRTVQPAR
ncbi:MATE family efflux transporter (plasmid) [Rhodococcus pseudokoreensis]|uniref:Probable multidrug resistance protein NorM n=1 Tax=Rhodococcus pseudokoreensis TaxID=2811421 RepID=A0A974VZE8_9NOCA|nr:MATE family efflux transporter [Rhodococcus pseudokoreensis]QSE88039.1 MATE family efflux transporter [Rhodococcus pseudokoreensis]